MKYDPSSKHPPETAFHEYLDGELSAQAATKFETHLVECEDCSRELARWQQTLEQISSLTDLPLENDLSELVLRKIEDVPETARLLNLILAEAALGITLAVVLWPLVRNWTMKTLSWLWVSFQTGLPDLEFNYSNLIEPLKQIHKGSFNLPIGLLLDESSLPILGGAALLLLIIGNSFIMKSAQFDRQRR